MNVIFYNAICVSNIKMVDICFCQVNFCKGQSTYRTAPEVGEAKGTKF